MSTVAAFEKEIQLQLIFLSIFVPQKQISKKRQTRTIFCGTGDSYVSSLLGEVFSEFRAMAHDPLDLLKNKKLTKKTDLYLISVSGNTISNINLANASKNTTAITSNPNSRLANSCKKSILLQYPNSGIFTSGSISFLASFLTCLSLVSNFNIGNPLKLFLNAKKQSSKVNLKGRVFILGDLHTFPVSMFCAAKLFEIGGLDVHYEKIEQFSHMGLFSAKRGDTVLIFDEKSRYNSMLASSLRKFGFYVEQFSPTAKNEQEKVLFFIFVSEFIALFYAKKKNLKDCYFVSSKTLRGVSSSMIY